jgi:AcrR family transcriptional regulator
LAYRTTPRIAEQKEARRQLFIETAVRLFGKHGYAATTVPMIVKEAGSSTGGFYFYFRNKEDIFAAAMKHLGERISAAVSESIAAEKNPILQMKAAVQGLFMFLTASPTEARILLVESAGLSERLEDIRRELLAIHSRGVENALKALAPELPAMSPPVVARCWVGAVYQAALWWLERTPRSRPPAEVVAREVAGFNLRGIGAGSAAIAATERKRDIHTKKRRSS